jgi:TRAP-type mannitol/chloroaromatic compound transport system permease small subunit
VTSDKLLQLSDRLSGFAEGVGKIGSIFILPLVFVTIWDVSLRKVGGLQVWMIENVSKYLGSTIVQELEWHFHTAFFALVLGYGFVYNRHVRVDLVREKLPFRAQAWIEFLGCTFFLIPYCLIVGYFAVGYAYESWLIGEISPSTVGLHYRWLIKSVLVIGLFVAAIAGIAVWLQTVVALWGPKDKRFKLMTLEWPEDYIEREGRRIAKAAAEKATEAARRAEETLQKKAQATTGP